MTILQYELKGFDGIILDNAGIGLELDNPYISQIKLKDDFKILEVVLNENILYCDNQIEIDNIINGLFLNILLKIKGHIQCPDIVLLNVIGENDKWGENQIYIKNEAVEARIRLQANEVYKNLMEDNFMRYANVEWQFVSAMLQNKNKVVTFMSLYDYLKEKIWQIHYSECSRPKQEQVTNYLLLHKQRYGTDLNFRRDNRGINVDMLTYLRNEIGHARIKSNSEDYRNLGKNVGDGMIRLTLQIINDVIMEQYSAC